MSYRLVQFGAVTLPELDPEDDVSTWAGRNSVVTTPGGWFDTRGTARSVQDPLRLSMRRALLSEATLEAGGSTVVLVAQGTNSRTEFNALRAMIGLRAGLWREWSDDADTREWTYARLMALTARADQRDNRGRVEAEFQFQIVSPCWYSETPYGVVGSGFTEGGGGNWSGTFTVANTGNRNVIDPRVVLYRHSADPGVTYLLFENATTGHVFSWTGLSAGGGNLVIDCGAQMVYNINEIGLIVPVDAYSGFTRPTTRERWLEFAPGNNTVNVVMLGADADTSIDVLFYPPWE